MDDELKATTVETRRLLIVALIALGLVLSLHFTPLKAWMEDIRALKAHIDAYGWKADAAFAAGAIAAIAIGVPRLALCGLAGALFGFVEGALLALAAGVLGSYGAFLLARWGGKAWVDRRLRKADPRHRALLGRPSIAGIFIARQLPVPAIVLNVLIGMLPVGHGTFLAGTLLGYVPSTAIVTLAGSSLGKESLERAMLQVSFAMLGLAVLSFFLVWISRRIAR